MNFAGLTKKQILAWTAVIILSITVIKLLLPTSTAADDGAQVKPVNIDLEQIIERGKLIVITEYAPSTYYIYKDQPAGYYFDLFTAWGRENNINIEFLPVHSQREMFEKLINGSGDVVAAYSFKDNRPGIAYSSSLWSSKLMLLQRNGKDRLTESKELNGKGIWVESNTNHKNWLEANFFKNGITPYLHQVPEDISMDTMAYYISSGKYDYLATDPQESARLVSMFPNISSDMQLGASLDVALAIRNNSSTLLENINAFIAVKDADNTLDKLFHQYFIPVVSTPVVNADINNEVSAAGNSIKISVYDHIIRKQADIIQWDWRLLASLICQESRFNPNAKGAGGAAGLMQLMPATAKHFGATNVYDPESNIRSGVSYIKALSKLWAKIPDPEQRVKFILASYNIGEAHVLDAVKLAKKYEADPNIWDNNVALYLEKKMDKSFYTDPVVKFGYCNGLHACKYVESVFLRYKKYIEQG